jgi:hypothetical protein
VPFIATMAIGFTDEQWARLVKLCAVPLPPEARADFGGCVGFYGFARDRQRAYRRAIGTSDDRKRWRRTGELETTGQEPRPSIETRDDRAP